MLRADGHGRPTAPAHRGTEPRPAEDLHQKIRCRVGDGDEEDLPQDIILNIASDNTTFIKKSVEEVAETLLISIILVTLIIYFFLLNIYIHSNLVYTICIHEIIQYFFYILLSF